MNFLKKLAGVSKFKGLEHLFDKKKATNIDERYQRAREKLEQTEAKFRLILESKEKNSEDISNAATNGKQDIQSKRANQSDVHDILLD